MIPVAVRIIATLMMPSAPGITSSIRPSCHFKGGKLSSFSSTTLPTCKEQGMSKEDALAKAKELRPTTSEDGTPAKWSSTALTPPTDTPKRVRAAEPTAQSPSAATPIGAEHGAPKSGRQDERPSTSPSAAAAEQTARESTSSAPTEPRASYGRAACGLSPGNSQSRGLVRA